MTLLIALALSIGLLAVVATWLFLGPLAAMNLQIWQAFIAWASHFHNGGKTDGVVKTVVCMSFGAVARSGRRITNSASFPYSTSIAL